MHVHQLFDYIVLGGGSGGLASARRAAALGAKVAVVEMDRLGGTCVIRGCVPKKVTYNLTHVLETLHDASRYGVTNAGSPAVDYAAFKHMRDAYVARLHGLYTGHLAAANITVFRGRGRFGSTSNDALVHIDVVDDTSTTVQLVGQHVLVATGGRPHVPATLDGAHLVDTSDSFFEWTTLPQSVVVVGTGYIGMELAGMLRLLGCAVRLFGRSSSVLRAFDDDLQRWVHTHYTDHLLIDVVTDVHVDRITRDVSGQLHVHYTRHGGDPEWVAVDRVVYATGRTPNTTDLALPVGVNVTPLGHIVVDAFHATHVPHIHALGDVCGRVELTPVAVAAGRHLADRLFGANSAPPLDYTDVPTVVFSHPPVAAVGLTQRAAERVHSDVKVYRSEFVNMYDALPGLSGTRPSKPKTCFKLVCVGPDEKVVGIHLFGRASDEILQGFAVALKMGATKRDFDATLAIHPTAAEELVTMR